MNRTHKDHIISTDVLNYVILPGIGGVSAPALSSAVIFNPGFETGAPSDPIFNDSVPNWRSEPL